MNLDAATLFRWEQRLRRSADESANVRRAEQLALASEIHEAWLEAVREETRHVDVHTRAPACDRPYYPHPPPYDRPAREAVCVCGMPKWAHAKSDDPPACEAFVPREPPSAPPTTIDLGADHLDDDEPSAGDVIVLDGPINCSGRRP